MHTYLTDMVCVATENSGTIYSGMVCVHQKTMIVVCASENSGASMVCMHQRTQACYVHQRTMVVVCASLTSGISRVCVHQRIQVLWCVCIRKLVVEYGVHASESLVLAWCVCMKELWYRCGVYICASQNSCTGLVITLNYFL